MSLGTKNLSGPHEMQLGDGLLGETGAGAAGTLPCSPIHPEECQVLQCDQSLGNNKARRDSSKGQESHSVRHGNLKQPRTAGKRT